MARSSECTEQYAQKVFDSADIVRDAMLRQQRRSWCLSKSNRFQVGTCMPCPLSISGFSWTAALPHPPTSRRYSPGGILLVANCPFLSVAPIHASLPDEEYTCTLASLRGFLCSTTLAMIVSPPIVTCRNLGSGQRGSALHVDAAKIRIIVRHYISSLYHRPMAGERR